MGKNYRIGENEIKIPGNDIWDTLDDITLLPLVGVHNRQPILNMSKIMVYIYTKYEQIN